MTPALTFSGVTFAYGDTPALRELSFTVSPGERVAVLGHNGAGKSTVMRLVTGLLRPGAGTVLVGDWDTCGRRPEELARRVGSVFQHADQQLFARSVREDVAFGPRAVGLPAAECAARAERAMDALGLAVLAHEHPYDIPPAYRKLAALAGALALEPTLLVLDEPTAGLDRALKARLGAALAARAAAGVALVVVTHDLGFAAETLDRALVLDHGRLAADAPLGELLIATNRLASLGLAPPPVAALSVALGLPGAPVRIADAARALARVAGDTRPV